jgi:hypothetical protein
MSSLTGKKLDYLITAAAGSGFLLFGYDQGTFTHIHDENYH